MEQYYLYLGEQQKGPFTLPQVRDMLKAGQLSATTLCWQQGFKDWIPISNLKSAPAPQAPRPVQQAPQAPRPQAPHPVAHASPQPQKPVAVQRPGGPKTTGPLRPKTAPMARLPSKPGGVAANPVKPAPPKSTLLADLLMVGGLVCCLYFVFFFNVFDFIQVEGSEAVKQVNNPELMQDRLIGAIAGIAACIVGAILKFLAKSSKN